MESTNSNVNFAESDVEFVTKLKKLEEVRKRPLPEGDVYALLLYNRIMQGENPAKDPRWAAILEQYKPMGVKILKKKYPTLSAPENIEEALQCINIAISKAVQSYNMDNDRGASLATRVSSQILGALKDLAISISQTSFQHDMVRNKIRDYCSKHPGHHSPEELARELHLQPSTVYNYYPHGADEELVTRPLVSPIAPDFDPADNTNVERIYAEKELREFIDGLLMNYPGSKNDIYCFYESVGYECPRAKGSTEEKSSATAKIARFLKKNKALQARLGVNPKPVTISLNLKQSSAGFTF